MRFFSRTRICVFALIMCILSVNVNVYAAEVNYEVAESTQITQTTNANVGLFGMYYAKDSNYAKSQGLTVVKKNSYIAYGKAQDAKAGVIFYPGAKVEETSYEPIITNLVNEGYFCAIVKMPLTLAMFNINGAEKVVKDYPEVDSWFLGGHSLGGAMASVCIKNHTNHYKGNFYLAAYPSSSVPAGFPMFMVRGENDQVINMSKYEETMKKNPQAVEYVIAGGNHSGFGNYGFQSGDGVATISQNTQWELTTKALINFFETTK